MFFSIKAASLTKNFSNTKSFSNKRMKRKRKLNKLKDLRQQVLHIFKGLLWDRTEGFIKKKKL